MYTYKTFESEVIMMDEEKKVIVERITTKFTQMDEDMKEKIAWYILGREEERVKQEQKTA